LNIDYTYLINLNSYILLGKYNKKYSSIVLTNPQHGYIVGNMILTRIKRGAARTNLLVRNQLETSYSYSVRFASRHINRAIHAIPTRSQILRSLRSSGLGVAAVYTAALPLLSVHASTVKAYSPEDTTDPLPYTQPLSKNVFTGIEFNNKKSDLLVVVPTEVHANQLKIGKSLDTEQNEERQRLEDQAKQQAEEARQREEVARQAELKRQEVIRVAAAEQARQAETRRLEEVAAQQKVVQQPASVPASGSVADIIVNWANHYGVDPNWMLRVARCESGLNPGAINHNYYAGGGNPSGVFQFLPQTFYANAQRAGIGSPDLWNVDQQAHTAAYMFSIGQSVQWACR
jgi:hypothetical protein